MNLTVDVGNTRIKLGVFDDRNALYSVARYDAAQISEIQTFCEAFRIKKVMVCASGEIPVALDAFLNAHYKTFYFTHTSPLPIANKYATPQTLGKDRLAAVVGAATLFPNKNCLVVVAGTALTFNVLHDNSFLGGTISAGLQMRFNALHDFTAHLPKLKADKAMSCPLIGDNTTQAINSGVLNGFIAEIEGMIGRYEKQLGALKIIFSGGNAEILLKNLSQVESSIETHIVLIGLNEVLNAL